MKKVQLSVNLAFNGNCEEVFNFYKSAIGGEMMMFRYRDMPADPAMPVPDAVKEKIMHVSLDLGNGFAIMGADAFAEFGGVPKAGDNITLSLYYNDDEAEARRVFKALSENGKLTMPLEPTFWAKLFGMFTDKYGIGWMVSYGEIKE